MSLPAAEVRARLVALYEKHRPEQAKHVDILLKAHAGREAELLAKVEKKFQRNPGNPDPPAKRARKEPVFAAGDRVMVPVAKTVRAFDPATRTTSELLWAPGEVVEVSPSGGYSVVTCEHAQPPHNGKRVVVADDDLGASIRPEVCFCTSGAAGTLGGRRMLLNAAVMPRREGQAFRFQIGNRVACRIDAIGDGTGAVEWVAGIVAAVCGREPGWIPDRVAAYRIRLDTVDPYNSTLGGVRSRVVWATRDEHWLVRPLLDQAPRPDRPSIAGSRYEVRPAAGDGDKDGEEEEKRVDTVDGYSKTRAQFMEAYGNDYKWTISLPAPPAHRAVAGDGGAQRWERYDHATQRAEPWERAPASGAPPPQHDVE